MAKFTHAFLQKIQSHDLVLLALIYENTRYFYGDLVESICEKIALLDSVPSGSCVGVVGDYDLDSIAFLLANLEKGNIIVPLANLDNAEIETKLREGQVDFLYTQGGLEKIQNAQQEKHAIIKSLQSQNANGLILFSSGSTGKPKAIVHNLDSILRAYLGKKPKKMSVLLFLMFDHIGGLNTLFNVLSIGACGVAIKNRKDINALALAIQTHKIFMLPASPSLLNLLLLSEAHKRFDLSALRLITYGTEQMPDNLLQRLKVAFPKVRFHQTFGTSEVGITQTTSFENAIKLENIAYKIQNGELYLKSNHQALGYLNADNSAFDSDGYFATGDLVESIQINGEEYLKILGRSKEVINVGGEKVLPQEVENVILEIPFIKDCLVYGESNAITGQSVSAKMVLEDSQIAEFFGKDSPTNIEIKKELRKFCKDKLAPFKIPSKVERVESLEISERFKKIRKGGKNG
ncbi:AMP-binding protein [Helicobacter sp. 23-1046]